jgi:hypothetical protein
VLPVGGCSNPDRFGCPLVANNRRRTPKTLFSPPEDVEEREKNDDDEDTVDVRSDDDDSFLALNNAIDLADRRASLCAPNAMLCFFKIIDQTIVCPTPRLGLSCVGM